jgi:rhamnulose-1-phosphate aldolase
MIRKVVGECGEVTATLWDRGWAERNAGNLSVDVTDLVAPSPRPGGESLFCKELVTYAELKNRVFLTTATGSRLREVGRRPERALLLTQVTNALDGYRVLWGGEGTERKATSEFVSHLKIHGFLRRSGLPAGTVLHTHPDPLIALTHLPRFRKEDALNRMLWSMHPEMKVFLPEGVGFAPYRVPGSEALADATLVALMKHRVVLWEKHGVVAVSKTLSGAFDLVDTVNKSAKIFFLCKSAGEDPEGLSEEQVRELEDAFGDRFRDGARERA